MAAWLPSVAAATDPTEDNVDSIWPTSAEIVVWASWACEARRFC